MVFRIRKKTGVWIRFKQSSILIELIIEIIHSSIHSSAVLGHQIIEKNSIPKKIFEYTCSFLRMWVISFGKAKFIDFYVCTTDVFRQLWNFFVFIPSLCPFLARSQERPLNIIQICILSWFSLGNNTQNIIQVGQVILELSLVLVNEGDNVEWQYFTKKEKCYHNFISIYNSGRLNSQIKRCPVPCCDSSPLSMASSNLLRTLHLLTDLNFITILIVKASYYPLYNLRK